MISQVYLIHFNTLELYADEHGDQKGRFYMQINHDLHCSVNSAVLISN